jgi:class 3 adenylate cyclase
MDGQLVRCDAGDGGRPAQPDLVEDLLEDDDERLRNRTAGGSQQGDERDRATTPTTDLTASTMTAEEAPESNSRTDENPIPLAYYGKSTGPLR